MMLQETKDFPFNLFCLAWDSNSGPQPSTAGGGNAHSCLLPTANKTQEEEADQTYFEAKRTVLRYIQT